MTTIHDIAKHTNVSIATVSNVFNRPHLVKSATKERVLQAAQVLNYKPNLFARGLAGGKTQTVGVLVPDLRYPFVATVVRGAEDMFREQGYLPFILSTDGDSTETIRLMTYLQTRRVDGFILVPSYFGIDEALLQSIKTMTEEGIPVVVAGYPLDDPTIECTNYHPQATTKKAVNHLIELGHRDIAFIGPQHSAGHAVARYLGYQESLLIHQIPIRPELTRETDMSPLGIRNATAELLSLPNPPTAIYALNDVVAMGVIDVCRERSIKIPEDLSLVTFDYEALSQRVTPQITSIVVPVYEVGRQSAALLLNRQTNPNDPIQQHSIPYRFEVRDTTAPPMLVGTETGVD
ncbi:MAG: LacI family DNA-binding transcriptional regulator [Chloroflexota bacterium]